MDTDLSKSTTKLTDDELIRIQVDLNYHVKRYGWWRKFTKFFLTGSGLAAAISLLGIATYSAAVVYTSLAISCVCLSVLIPDWVMTRFHLNRTFRILHYALDRGVILPIPKGSWLEKPMSEARNRK